MCANSPEHPGAERIASCWTEEQQKLLSHERFISEICKLRQRTSDQNERKPRWLQFLESSGGTAIIAALLGGALVQLISASIQNHQKMREFNQAWMQARGNQALTAYKERLDHEQTALEHVYAAIGEEIQVSEDLIELAGPGFDPKRYTGDAEKSITQQRHEVREQHDKVDDQWRAQKESLWLLIAQYHHDDSEVIEAWPDLVGNLTKYTTCADDLFDESLKHSVGERTVRTACAKERTALDNTLQRFTGAIANANSKMRADWESPDTLMKKLEQAEPK